MRWRGRACQGLIALVLLSGTLACSGEPGGGTPGEGFAIPATELVPPPIAAGGHPDPDPWTVEVARVEPDTEEITVHRRLPTGAVLEPVVLHSSRGGSGPDLALSPGENAESQGSGLTPIPSPGLSWGSALVDGNWVFDNPTLIGSPLVFLVVENRGEWLKVRAPVRPNHQEGWIRADEVTITRHRWHVTVDVTDNQLQVWNGDELIRETGTVDGKPSTPTPLGRFYINEMQEKYPASAYGSFILSTNGFSDTLERFGGEVPIFAIHGTAYEGSIGSDISNGCIRIPNPVIEWMAATLPVGTPVDVIS